MLPKSPLLGNQVELECREVLVGLGDSRRFGVPGGYPDWALVGMCGER